MAVPKDPTSAEIAHFLSTRSGDQMMQLVQSIREPAAQATLTASLLFVPPTVGTRTTAPEKTRKALNAFVGFRCYYILIPVFKPWPMKKLSNPMGVMWEADPNKSLWSLMTKAWSVIRDQIGKDKAPLDQFFRIICPYLNIPSPGTYLERCGWILNTDEEGTPTLLRDFAPSPGAFSAGFADMALSVEDIISYCQSMGYAQEYISDFETHSPTSLAQSCSQFTGKSTSVKSQTQIASSTHEGRLAARNKRRAKRQTARDTGVAPVLQQQIVNAHITDGLNVTYHDNSILGHSEPVEFHDDLADMLINHIGQDHQGNPSTPADFIVTGNPIMASWTDWSAFRPGADENATLPSFDPATL
ncbi:MAT1-1-1 [Macroventuria anomochaeta]|uniref:MAT1-1-1 n=1 Tax=Macroventuria anomochaeta TaxID=301207 RepID=A0ACB6RVF1_9PLEO|nr:MAT1-1-1 [Macroventuria anomochaeta]KAF2625950.1 MAT1-1-1 [Macroventuria anomochaeta]